GDAADRALAPVPTRRSSDLALWRTEEAPRLRLGEPARGRAGLFERGIPREVAPALLRSLSQGPRHRLGEGAGRALVRRRHERPADRKSTRLNSTHANNPYAV